MAKAIQDNDPLYNLLSPLVQYGTRCHYNSFVVRGLGNLPADGPYIIAPCHQQALMEPLAVLCFAPKAPVFLARADLFRKPTLLRVLTFLKIMPVYRIRDGKESLGRNQEVFDRCRDVLLSGSPLCLMAEGRHNNRHHLLPFGKGMFRIAAETQLALGDRPLYIVPTGIDFDEYEQPYANLVVNIGRPIAVAPFMECGERSAESGERREESGERSAESGEMRSPNSELRIPTCCNRMRDAVHGALLPLMHDIRDEERYDDTMTLCQVLGRTMRRRWRLGNTAWNRFLVRQRVACSPLPRPLLDKAAALRGQCRRLGLAERVVAEHWPLASTLAALAAVVAALLAMVWWQPLKMTVLFCAMCFPMALLPTHLLMRRMVKDPQFRSSFNWGVRFFGTVVYTAIIAVVVAATGGMWMSRLLPLGGWWGLVAVAVAVVGARLQAPVYTFLRRVCENVGYWWLRLVRPAAMRRAGTLLADIRDNI